MILTYWDFLLSTSIIICIHYIMGFNGNVVLAFNYGVIVGVLISLIGLLYLMTRTPSGDYNTPAVESSFLNRCEAVFKYVTNGNISLAQVINDISNGRVQIGARLEQPRPVYSSTAKSTSFEDPTTIDNLSTNSEFHRPRVWNGDARTLTIRGVATETNEPPPLTLATSATNDHVAHPNDTPVSASSSSRSGSAMEETNSNALREVAVLQEAVAELEHRREAWSPVISEQTRIEQLAQRAVKERHGAGVDAGIDTNEVQSSAENVAATGTQLLEAGFKRRQRECIMRQKEIRKLELFLSDLGRVFGRFTLEVTRLSKDANNIGNALMTEAVNASMFTQTGTSSPTPSNSASADLIHEQGLAFNRMDAVWKAYAIYLSHCARDTDVISAVIQNGHSISSKLKSMADEQAMFEKKLSAEGNALFAQLHQCERVYDAQLKARALIRDKLQNSFEKQIASDSKRRMTLAAGKMGASASVAAAVGREAVETMRLPDGDKVLFPMDGSPSGERQRRLSVLDAMPAAAASVAAIGMGTTSNFLTKKEMIINEKLTMQLEQSEEACEELYQELATAKENLQEYLPRVIGDFDRIAIKSEIEIRTQLITVSQKFEVLHEKGLPASHRLQIQIGTMRGDYGHGHEHAEPDGLDDNTDLLRVLHGMIRQRTSSRNRARNRVSSWSSSTNSTREHLSTAGSEGCTLPLSPAYQGSPLMVPPGSAPKSPEKTTLASSLDATGSEVTESRVRIDSVGSVPTTEGRDGSELEAEDLALNDMPMLDMTSEATACLAATPLSRLPMFPSCFNDAVGNESAVWFNAIFGRIYRDLSVSPYFHNYFCSTITSALNKGNRPSYIDSFVVSDVTFGSMPPSLCNFCWNPVNSEAQESDTSQSRQKKMMNDFDELNPDSNVTVTANIACRSGLTFTITTKLRLLKDRVVINIKLFVEVLELTGSCRIGMSHSSSFFGFLEEPHLYVNIRSEIGNSEHFKLLDVPQLSAVIRQKMKSYITKKLVSPNKHHFRLPHPRAWWPKGTGTFFSSSSEKGATIDPVTGLRDVAAALNKSAESAARGVDSGSVDLEKKPVKEVASESPVEAPSPSRLRSHTTTRQLTEKSNPISGTAAARAVAASTEDDPLPIGSQSDGLDGTGGAKVGEEQNKDKEKEAEEAEKVENAWDEDSDDDTASDSSAERKSASRRSMTVRKRRDTSVTIEYLKTASISDETASVSTSAFAPTSTDVVEPSEMPKERRRSIFERVLGSRKADSAAPAKSVANASGSEKAGVVFTQVTEISEDILAAARAHMEAADAATYEYESSLEDDEQEQSEVTYAHAPSNNGQINHDALFGNINLSTLRRRSDLD